VGATRTATGSYSLGQEREANSLRRRGIKDEQTDLHARGDQVRELVPRVLEDVGEKISGPEDHPRVRQWPLPHDQGGTRLAGRLS